MKMRLQNMDVQDKKVIVRVDYNVPVIDGQIIDDLRIQESLETIQYLLQQNARIILLSHFGKVKTEEDKKKYSLEIVARHLQKLLGREIYFSKENFGEEVKKRVEALQPRDILLLENTRFMDVPQKLESHCDAQLSLFWASLGDVFVMDAFGSSHRKHASTYGISEYIPSCIGFLVQKEIESLDQYLKNPQKPFTVIMGGAKLDDKLNLMEALLPKCDYLLCGGGIANTCLKALGFQVGESIVSEDPEIIKKVQNMLLENKNKFMVPLDAIVGSTYDKNYIQYKMISNIGENEMILDIGNKTLQKYKTVIEKSKTVFMNGTVGLYEDERYANGTKELLSLLKNSSAQVIVGGGDASSSVRYFGFTNSMTFISSGGGATLEYISSGHLIGLDGILDEESSIETLDL